MKDAGGSSKPSVFTAEERVVMREVDTERLPLEQLALVAAGALDDDRRAELNVAAEGDVTLARALEASAPLSDDHMASLVDIAMAGLGQQAPAVQHEVVHEVVGDEASVGLGRADAPAPDAVASPVTGPVMDLGHPKGTNDRPASTGKETQGWGKRLVARWGRALWLPPLVATAGVVALAQMGLSKDPEVLNTSTRLPPYQGALTVGFSRARGAAGLDNPAVVAAGRNAIDKDAPIRLTLHPRSAVKNVKPSLHGVVRAPGQPARWLTFPVGSVRVAASGAISLKTDVTALLGGMFEVSGQTPWEVDLFLFVSALSAPEIIGLTTDGPNTILGRTPCYHDTTNSDLAKMADGQMYGLCRKLFIRP